LTCIITDSVALAVVGVGSGISVTQLMIWLRSGAVDIVVSDDESLALGDGVEVVTTTGPVPVGAGML